MSDLDFARYSAKQARQHCENNHRQVALDRVGYQAQHQQALARCDRLEREAHEEQRAFRAWRTGFLVPRREAWGHLGAATEQALVRAHQEFVRLRTTWAALAPFLTEGERLSALEQPLPNQAVASAGTSVRPGKDGFTPSESDQR